MKSVKDRLLGGSSTGREMGEFTDKLKAEAEQPRPPDVVEREGVDLNRGKRKVFVELITKAGRSLAIPYHFIDDIESDAPHYKKIVITFVKRDLVTVTLHSAAGGSLSSLHRRLLAGLAGEIHERDGLQGKAVKASLDTNGDEFAVAEMRIESKKT